jgi:acetyltransferase
MVMFGLGGIHVEILKDVVFKLAPLSLTEAQEMVNGIRASVLLDGARGKPGIDRRSIINIILRVARLLSNHPEIIELDLNPVMFFPRGEEARAVDVRIKIDRKSKGV